MYKYIPLWEIERSIAINCAIDRKALKPLQLPKWQGLTNQGVGRCIFIYIATFCGYNQEEVCDYLTIADQEYKDKVGMLEELYAHGKLLFETLGTDAGYLETRDTYLLFYRKLILAKNYLRFRFNIDFLPK